MNETVLLFHSKPFSYFNLPAQSRRQNPPFIPTTFYIKLSRKTQMEFTFQRLHFQPNSSNPSIMLFHVPIKANSSPHDLYWPHEPNLPRQPPPRLLCALRFRWHSLCTSHLRSNWTPQLLFLEYDDQGLLPS